MKTETRAANDLLKVRIDPRLITEVEEYAERRGLYAIDYAVTDLLRAGLSKLAPRAGGANANGKRKARAVTA